MFHLFNISTTTTTLICYQQPRRCYELGLDSSTLMIHRMPMKMSGSGEQHSCFVFIKKNAFGKHGVAGGCATTTNIASNIVISDTEICHEIGWSNFEQHFQMPTFPKGCADFDSPVRHGETYNNTGITLASNCMKTTNIMNVKIRNENRKLYSDWIEDQLGLNNATRSRRRSRTSTKQKEMNVDGLKSFR